MSVLIESSRLYISASSVRASDRGLRSDDLFVDSFSLPEIFHPLSVQWLRVQPAGESSPH